MRPVLAAALLSLSFPIALLAQDVNGDGWVTYLLPLNVPTAVNGAQGSRWQTELWVHNAMSQPMNLVSPQILFDPPLEFPVHVAGVTEKAFAAETLDGAPIYSALLFRVAARDAQPVLMSRLYELSRHAQPAGVEVPVIREDQFFTKASRFIAIPNSVTDRVALRVYDPLRRGDAAARVELLDEKNTVLATTTLQLVPQTADSISPGYAAILDVASAFPQLAGIDRFDIRITPLIENMEYWAFVSVTDQDTQTVMPVTAPQ